MDFYNASVGDVITSPSDRYIVHQVLGTGAFGDVALCQKLRSKQTVALKVLKCPEDFEVGKKEMEILKEMKAFGSEHFNIVCWYDSFHFRGHFCHEFETLDISLSAFLRRFPTRSLQLKHIRPMLHQIAGALMFLKNVGIIHRDLKPDNIMMVDHLAQPFRLKLIDFGVASSVSDVKQGSVVQPLWYRAPEVLVGAHYNEAIDMWSIGCTVAEMFLGKVLFRAMDQYDMMRHIVQMVGQPPKEILDTGLRTHKYFRLPDGYTDWRFRFHLLKPLTQCTVKRLNDMYTHIPFGHQSSDDEAEAFDWSFFIDLVKKMLDVDPASRITPEGIVQHPFITLEPFQGCFDHIYFEHSQDIMMQVLSPCTEEEQPTPSTSVPETNRAVIGTAATRASPSSPKRRRGDVAKMQGQDSCKGLKNSQRDEENNSPLKKRKVNDQGHIAEESPGVIIINTPVSQKRQRSNDNTSPSLKRRRDDPGHNDEDIMIVDSVVSQKRQRQEEVIDLTSSPKQRQLSVTQHKTY